MAISHFTLDGDLLVLWGKVYAPLDLVQEVGYPRTEVERVEWVSQGLLKEELATWLSKNKGCELVECCFTSTGTGVTMEARIRDKDLARVSRLQALLAKGG